jgi:hypothetical protein
MVIGLLCCRGTKAGDCQLVADSHLNDCSSSLPPAGYPLQGCFAIGIVGIRVHPIVEQVAVVIPGVIDSIDTGQPVGIVIDIGVIGHETQHGFPLRLPVADGIVSVMIVIVVRVVGFGQAVERVIDIGDRDLGLLFRQN